MGQRPTGAKSAHPTSEAPNEKKGESLSRDVLPGHLSRLGLQDLVGELSTQSGVFRRL
jgi:hypothetical protein